MIDLSSGDTYGNESFEELARSTITLFEGVAHDLDVEDPADEAFVCFCGDALSDARVPPDLVSHLKEWLRCGAPRL